MSDILKDATARPWATTNSKPRKITAKGVLICNAVIRNSATTKQNAKGKCELEAEANARLIVTAVNSYEPMLAACASLFDAIAHGDEDHRDWLKEAIDDHFAGRPVERSRGKGAGEIDDLDEPEIEDAWELWWSEFYDAVEKEQTDSFDIGDLQLAYSRAYQAGHASAIALAKGETS